MNEGHEIQTMSADENMVAMISRAEIDQQISTAKKYPRSIKRFVDEATAMVTLNESIAQQCIYALPRREKDKTTGQWVTKVIEGPSARFGEIVASAWGNCRAGARVVNEASEFITSQGVFHDLERNVAITYEVQRRITGANGARYNPDMIGVTANAACSIALRNAILKGIPKAFWDSLYQKARAVVAGDIKTLANKRADAVKQFQIYGVSEAQILSKLGRDGMQDVTVDDLVVLFGMMTAIRDGDTTPEQAFAPDENAKPEVSMPASKSEKKKQQTPAEPAGEPGGGAGGASDPVGADRVSSGQIAYLRSKMSGAGVSEESVCARFGIAKLEDISAADWRTQKVDILAMG